MTEPAQHAVDKCASCGQEDNHPKLHHMTPGEFGLGWKTFHHDCAALLGHAKAALIVQHTGGAKGDDLRALLTDPDHPVHAAVVADTETHAAAVAAEGASA